MARTDEKQAVLVVEDEELMRNILRRLLTAEGYDVFTADSAETALQVFAQADVAVTLTDIKMAGRDGLALLDQIKSLDEEAVVIIMTAFSSVDTAIAALRKGAYDYVTKPFNNDALLQTIRNAATQRRLFAENRLLRREVERSYSFAEIVGTSAALGNVLSIVRKVADTNASVLITGESGTGKELIARALHYNSSRADKPFVAVNCGAIPGSLLESELFGHLKGSFTGAVSDTKGLFRSAAGGTMFLDEISEMPTALQVKLLRALQEHEVTPIGSSVAYRFDARIAAATNKDLKDAVANGHFREDLYYRLNVVEIRVPPLRERRDDIPLLVAHFLTRAAKAQGVDVKPLTEEARRALSAYMWPGNVRELQNAIERAFILSDEVIDLDSLPAKVCDASGAADGQTLEAVERRYILEVLEASGGDKAAAAERLGIDLSTLYRKLKRYSADQFEALSSSTK